MKDIQMEGTSSNNNTKQAAWVAIGSLCSFGFAIVSSMILSRFFGKEDYGTYKQVIYVYNTLLTVFTLGLPRAYSYFLPRVQINTARSLISKMNLLFLFLGGIFSLLLFFCADIFAELLHNYCLGKALRYFSIVPLLMLPTMGLEGVLASFQSTKRIALYTIITRVSMLICVVIPVVIWNGTYLHAIIGFVVASFISCLVALFLEYYPLKNVESKKTSVSYKEILSFSIPLLLASIWGIIITSSDQFFISRYYGTTAFADFSNGSMDLPFVGMIIGAAATVLSPLFSKMSYEKDGASKEMFQLWKSALDKSAALIYPLTLYCIFFADIIMIVLYGAMYEGSAVYFRIRLLTNFFTVAAFGPFLINTGQVKLYSSVHMYGAIILVLLDICTVHIFDTAVSVAWVSSICTIGRILFFLIVISHYFGVPFYKLCSLNQAVKIIISSCIILGVERYFLNNLMHLSYLNLLIVSLVLYGIIFFVYSYFAKIDYISIIKNLRR